MYENGLGLQENSQLGQLRKTKCEMLISWISGEGNFLLVSIDEKPLEVSLLAKVSKGRDAKAEAYRRVVGGPRAPERS